MGNPLAVQKFEALDSPSNLPDASTPADKGGEKPAAQPNGEKAAETEVKLTDAELAEVGRTLVDLGITPESANELLRSQGVLEHLLYVVKNDPEQFLNELRGADPRTYEKIIDAASDQYLARHPVGPDGEKGADGSKGGGVPSAVVEQLQRLNQELTSLKEGREREAQVAQQRQVQTQYESKVNTLLDKVEAKGPDRENIAARVDRAVSRDAAALQRINAGNFLDVTRHFQAEYNRYASEIKAKAADEGKVREDQKLAAPHAVTPGASPTGGEKPGAGDLWDEAAAEFAQALQKTAKKA